MSIQASRYDTSAPEAPMVLAWQDGVAKSIARSTSGEAERVHPRTTPAPSGVVINNNIITTPAPPVVVTRFRTEEPKPSDEISSRTFIGTVLGAAAGGVIMYAMTKSSEQSSKQPEPQKIITYRTIEAPPIQHYASLSRAPEYSTYSKQGSVVDSRLHSRPIPVEASPRTHSVTAGPESEYSRHSRNPGDEVIVLSNGSRVAVPEPRPSHASHASSSQQTVRQPTEVRSARNVPLPYSAAASRASRDKEYMREARIEGSRSTVVTPHDSISQVSTKRSKASGRSNHHREEDEHRSSKGSKSGSKTGSKKDSSSRVSERKVMGARGSVPGF